MGGHLKATGSALLKIERGWEALKGEEEVLQEGAGKRSRATKRR